MIVYWLEQAAADVPADDRWVSAREADRMAGMRFAKRRADWRLGRWTAKRAVAAYLSTPYDAASIVDIEIRAAEDGAPEVFFRNGPAPLSISLTHCNGRAVCAVAPEGASVGCDLEAVEPRDETFAADYFTAEEQELVGNAPAAERAFLITLLWSAKESALKALRLGLRRDTRSVAVTLGRSLEAEWCPLEVRDTEGGRVFSGWWRKANGFVLTVAADPSPAAPVCLSAASTASPGARR